MGNFIKFCERYYLLLIIAAYCIAAIFIFPHFKYFVDSDGVSYVNIAAKYSVGNFKDAINGFWSPMISWLIAIAIFVGINKIIAAKIVGVLVGIVAVFTFDILSKFLIKNKLLQIAATTTTAGLVLLYCMLDIAADISLLAGLFFYFYLFLKGDYLQNTKHATLLGATAALCYFAKYYFFPFFLLHLFVTTFLLNKNVAWRTKLLNGSISIITFLIVASPWILLISHKYQTGLIYCTSGKIDISLELNNWVRNLNSLQHFFLFPNNSSATDFTEDVFYVQGNYVSFFDSKNILLFELNHIKESLIAFSKIINQFSIFIVALLVIAAVYVFQQKTDLQQKRNLKIFLLSMPIYCSGYWLMHSEYRYYFILDFLCIIFGCVCIEQFIFNNNFTKIFKAGLLSCFLISFYFFPIKLCWQFNNNKKYVHEVAVQLKNEFKLKGTVLGEGGDYEDTQYACFAADLQNVIINPSHWNEREKLKEELLRNKIDYYFYWHWKNDQSDTLKSFYGFEEITKGKIYGLQIFKIAQP